MTKEQVTAIKTAMMFYHYVLPKTQEKELEKAWLEMTNLSKSCDHHYPDGSSSILSSFLCRVCDICGETDF